MPIDTIEIVVPGPVTVVEIEVEPEPQVIEVLVEGPQGPAGSDIAVNLSLIFEGALI